jgi:hypothetical protein
MPRAHTITFFGFVTAILLALCVGAVWPVVAVLSRSDAPWMALVAAVVAVFSVGMFALQAAWLRVALALALTAISVVYAQYLLAAAVVTGIMGLPFRDVVASIGPEMACALACTRATPTAAALILGALIAAALGAYWRKPA